MSTSMRVAPAKVGRQPSREDGAAGTVRTVLPEKPDAQSARIAELIAKIDPSSPDANSRYLELQLAIQQMNRDMDAASRDLFERSYRRGRDIRAEK